MWGADIALVKCDHACRNFGGQFGADEPSDRHGERDPPAVGNEGPVQVTHRLAHVHHGFATGLSDVKRRSNGNARHVTLDLRNGADPDSS